MPNNSLQSKRSELVKDFRSGITNIEQCLREIADGKNVIVGTKENPITPHRDICSTESRFSHGVYAIEMFVKKDSIVVGAIHKDEHISFLMSGHVTVVSESGVPEHKGPDEMVEGPGVNSITAAHGDTRWYTENGNLTKSTPRNEEEIERRAERYAENRK